MVQCSTLRVRYTANSNVTKFSNQCTYTYIHTRREEEVEEEVEKEVEEEKVTVSTTNPVRPGSAQEGLGEIGVLVDRVLAVRHGVRVHTLAHVRRRAVAEDNRLPFTRRGIHLGISGKT
jgi:hypothetical protein